MKRVAVVMGAPSAVIQNLFRELAERWQSDMRIAGVIEEPHGLADRKCNAGYLRSITNGTLYPIFQDLGPGAEACHLEGAGAISATAAIEQDIAAGCDLVMLSKFGKLETMQRGLWPAFAAAALAGLLLAPSIWLIAAVMFAFTLVRRRVPCVGHWYPLGAGCHAFHTLVPTVTVLR